MYKFLQHTSIAIVQPPNEAVVHCLRACWNLEIDDTSLSVMIVDQSYEMIFSGSYIAS